MTTSRSGSDTRQLVAAAALVCVGYYLACHLGLMLRVWSTTPSVLWPPNALLTAALLLTPPRRWFLLLAAVAPAHFLVELQTGWPLPLIAALLLTNCSEALLGAGGVWLLGRSPRRLDTLRALMIFLASVVVVGPVVSSFLDAAAVTWWRGEPYWQVWRTRCLANMLTELTVVPAIVGVVAHVLERRRAPLRDYAEALLLTVGLIGAGAGSFSWWSASPAVRAVGAYVPLAVQLPFVLWAAMRFGPTGVSAALLLIALGTIWTAAGGVGPFDRLPPEITVSALQVSLLTVSVPMLTLAVMLRERRNTGRELVGRLRFEELLSRLSGAFVQIPSDQMEAAFDTWLARLGAFFEVDCLMLFRLDAAKQDMTAVSTWVGPAFGDVPRIAARADFPWGLDQILQRRTVVLDGVDGFPEDALRDRAAMAQYGFGSALAFPLLAGDRVVGVLSFNGAARRAWPDELIGRVRLTGEVLANALARKQSEDALRGSELMKGAILSSLSSGVAVLDRSGRGVAVNDIWTRYAKESAMPCDLLVNGDNFIELWRGPGAAGCPTARALADGVEALLEGRRSSFRHEYPAQDSSRWFVVSAFPFNRPEGGAVVILADVTDRRQAELDVQRARDELAHVARVTTMGELTASIAHQLNQPLTGIMTNAQVLLRMTGKPPFDVAEIRAILSDIVDDDRRASEVIRRLSALLRKGESIHEPVDVGAMIREVVELVSSNATIRNVAVDLALSPEPLIVSGDRIQLQQVILNLILNGIEAIGDLEDERRVSISSHAVDGSARIVVRDSGVGIADAAILEVFEPFYTTKPGGMGMGLSIARSIVEAYDGSILARNGETKGAIVEVTLPLAQAVEVPVVLPVSTG